MRSASTVWRAALQARRYDIAAMAKPRTPTILTSPQDAAIAFYQAFEAKDIETMMSTWAEDEDIVCVHPGWPRLTGPEQVRENWALIFRSGERLKFHLSSQVCMQGMMISVHSLLENVLVAGEKKPRQPAVTTNVYLRTESGWRMIVHHASIAPPAAAAEPEAPPKMLH